jgi:pimeloyl-ACP methyl ester carboxylesterase
MMYSDQELITNLPGFASRFTDTNGINLHYVEGGIGEPLIMLPGWPETWWAYHKVIPLLASKYRIIVVDLRGMGSSGKPLAGYDKRNMAKDVYELMQTLGYSSVHICGHDIGAHVAFSFAANYPEATRKLIMIDTPHPDESMYQLPMLPIPGLSYTYPWWLAFNQVKDLPEVLLAGRMRLVIDWVFNALLKNANSITDFDKSVYSQSYDSPEGIRSSNSWYQTFTQDIQDIKTYPRVNVPTIGIASNSSFEMLSGFLTKFCTDIEIEKIEDSGHFLLFEQPRDVASCIKGLLQ